jgi:hypothetical protein
MSSGAGWSRARHDDNAPVAVTHAADIQRHIPVSHHKGWLLPLMTPQRS